MPLWLMVNSLKLTILDKFGVKVNWNENRNVLYLKKGSNQFFSSEHQLGVLLCAGGFFQGHAPYQKVVFRYVIEQIFIM